MVTALCLLPVLTTLPAVAHGSGDHGHGVPDVVVSIKPIQSLVASVMEGVETPVLLLGGAASPHTATLRPSQAAELQDADIVFWVGPQMETYLSGPIETIATHAKSVALMKAPGVELLPFREGGAFEAHDHGDHDHAETADAAHDHDHDHDNAAEAARDHDHGADTGHDHAQGTYNPHVWLDPENARAMVDTIAATLSQADPDHAATYRQNAEATKAQLTALETDIATQIAPVKGRHFIVFHDAYQYYEHRFGISASGSVTVSPEVMPGADRLREIRNKITQTHAACVFAEPQFEPRLVNTVIEGTQAKSGVLDPLGADLQAGPGLYNQLLGNLTTSLVNCLSQGG